MIQVKGLTKVYGKKQNTFAALTDIDLEIPEGATVAIIGKSGSGKSTLMHIMSGLDRPTTGSVRIGNHDIHAFKRKALDRFRAKEMSFIFQAFFVEANQTCYQNVVLPLEIAKVRRTKRKQLVMDALAAVDLADKVNSNAKNLSGGQKQRLAIARSIVNSPKLIFADEPTGNLDSATGDMIIDLLFELNKKIGCTLVIVTHDQELADKCQMQIQLKDGRIIDTKLARKAAKSQPKRATRKVAA
jgi:putative ABC transport system ATP-binding protein